MSKSITTNYEDLKLVWLGVAQISLAANQKMF